MTDETSSVPDNTRSDPESFTATSSDNGSFPVFEKMVEAALKLKGYTILNDHFTRSDTFKEHRVDILAIKRSDDSEAVVAVDCKNSDTPCAGQIIEHFITKLKSAGIGKGIFVSFGGFTRDAEKKAKEYNLELWDYSDVLNKTRVTSECVLSGKDVAICAKTSYNETIALNLLNKAKVRVNSAILTYIPFITCEYALKMSVNDKYGKVHDLKERNRIIIDPMSFKVLRGDDPQLSSYYMRILEEINHATLTCQVIAPANGYSVNKVRPAVDEEKARAAFKKKAGTILKQYITYSETDSICDDGVELMAVEPGPDDVDIVDMHFVYIPKWEVEFQCKGQIYTRDILAYSNTVLRDTISECSICHNTVDREGMLKAAVTMCDECGKPFCKDHVHKCAECDTYLCIDHINTCLSCGRHFCDSHAGMECSTSEKYSNLLALRKNTNVTLLRVLGITFLFISAGFILWAIYETGGSAWDTFITLMFFGGPLAIVMLSIFLFGLVFVSLNYGGKILKTREEAIPSLKHKVVKKSAQSPLDTGR